jgi:hypothetical protein
VTEVACDEKTNLTCTCATHWTGFYTSYFRSFCPVSSGVVHLWRYEIVSKLLRIIGRLETATPAEATRYLNLRLSTVIP